MTRRQLLVSAAGLVSGCARKNTHDANALSRGVNFLCARQEADGGWHSATYGLLRSGQSLTPFILDALLHTPGAPSGVVDKAVAFVLVNLRDGALGLADSASPDYPNYATALAVRALGRSGDAGVRGMITAMAAYLRSQQFTEANGWKADSAPYGGWGMGGGLRVPPHPGHVDISMTRYVLQALRESGTGMDEALVRRASTFVERCQNFDPKNPDALDGGFFFSTVVLDANKAGHDGKRYRSYGTTTADGILALLALGHPLDHPRVRAARRWLVNHHIPSGAPGFVGEPYQRWKAGLLYYYAAASAEAFRSLGEPAPDLAPLLKLQRADGSWANPENLVKEDDPLIATTFAINALAHATRLAARWPPLRRPFV